MATKKKVSRKKQRIKAVWERGYNGHVLWLGKEKLGKVTLLSGAQSDSRGKYRWDAAGKGGYSDQLEKARGAVELALAAKDKQLDLFE